MHIEFELLMDASAGTPILNIFRLTVTLTSDRLISISNQVIVVPKGNAVNLVKFCQAVSKTSCSQADDALTDGLTDGHPKNIMPPADRLSAGRDVKIKSIHDYSVHHCYEPYGFG